MTSKLLNVIGNWFNEMRNSNKYASVSIDKPVFSCPDTDNPSVYVDAETTTKLARITVWASQECSMEILSKATGVTCMFKQIRMDAVNYKEICTAFLSELNAAI